MARRPSPSPQPAPLLDELRRIDASNHSRQADSTLCVLRVITGLDAHDWSSLRHEHSLEHWCAVPLDDPGQAPEALASTLARSVNRGADALHRFLKKEIDRSRTCQVPLAVAVLGPDEPLAESRDTAQILGFLQSLKRSFDFAAALGDGLLAVVFSGASLGEAERQAGGFLRRLRSAPTAAEERRAVLCSAGLAGYGGCVELTPDDLLKRAEEALQAARRQGGNRLEVAPPVDVGMAPKDTLVRASEKHFLFTGKKAGE